MPASTIPWNQMPVRYIWVKGNIGAVVRSSAAKEMVKGILSFFLEFAVFYTLINTEITLVHSLFDA